MLNRLRESAFSVVELLIAAAISGALCGVTVAAISSARNGLLDSRLQSDVDTINYAIDVFRSEGGSMEGLSDPNAILDRLKDHQLKETNGVVQFLGAADQMMDLRLTARVFTEEEIEFSRLRAIWDPENHCFFLDSKGRGVGEFFLESQ